MQSIALLLLHYPIENIEQLDGFSVKDMILNCQEAIFFATGATLNSREISFFGQDVRLI